MISNSILTTITFKKTDPQKNILKANAQNYTNYDENYGKTWMYFPDGDGVPQVIYLTDSPMGASRSLSVKSRTNFELYTRYAFAK